MQEHRAEALIDEDLRRRQVLRFLSTAACGGLTMALAGCAEGPMESWERPAWFRSKRGTNGNGGRD